jgi:phage/plasmid-associated DNA primase
LKTLRTQTSKSSAYTDIIKHILTKARQTEEDFNGNPYLLGFNNGVYDLLADEFRDYTFNDYITITTKYDYKPPDYNIKENQELKEELATLIETIHPDPDYRLLYLQTLASGLDGRAYQKLFLFNGQGGNGKGLTGSLMDITLGEYYHQPSNGILKDVEKANTPSPDMINLKHKRYINFKEVAGSIRVAVLRNLTGGGKFCGRFLNQNPEHFFMSGTFVMEFNNAPELDGKPQRADYRRLLDVFFPVNFTDDPDKIDKEIGGLKYKKANTRYETQEFLNAMRDIFLDMLLGVYRTYKDKEGKTGIIFTIPESIRKKTDEFIANQNLFVKIFNTNWLKVDILPDNPEDERKKTIPLVDMWENISNSNEYKCLSYRDKRQYNRNEFYKWAEENFLVIKPAKSGKMVKGIARNMNGEEDEEGEENEVGNLDENVIEV